MLRHKSVEWSHQPRVYICTIRGVLTAARVDLELSLGIRYLFLEKDGYFYKLHCRDAAITSKCKFDKNRNREKTEEVLKMCDVRSRDRFA